MEEEDWNRTPPSARATAQKFLYSLGDLSRPGSPRNFSVYYFLTLDTGPTLDFLRRYRLRLIPSFNSIAVSRPTVIRPFLRVESTLPFRYFSLFFLALSVFVLKLTSSRQRCGRCNDWKCIFFRDEFVIATLWTVDVSLFELLSTFIE